MMNGEAKSKDKGKKPVSQNSQNIVIKAADCLKKHCKAGNGNKLIVGVSGGADSMCLLHVLNSLEKPLGIKLEAVHVNHMLRGKESDRDQKLIEKACSELKIPVHVFKQDVGVYSKTKRISLEEAGREVRYYYLEKALENSRGHYIAVAHNMNDQAETILMNIFRGTGPEGLRGMESGRGNIIRPLLEINRNEIEQYCIDNSVEYVIDSSNLKLDFTRNRIRLALMPQITEITGIDPVRNISRMAKLVKEDSAFMHKAVLDAYEKVLIKESNGVIDIDIMKFKDLHPAIKKRIVRLAYSKIRGNLKNFENRHTENVLDLAKALKTGKRINLPCNVSALISYNVLRFTDGDEKRKTHICRKLSIPGTTFIEELNVKISASVIKYEDAKRECLKTSQQSSTQLFDYEKLEGGINIRNRNNGDVFKPYGSNGTKKLKKMLIDDKIPREERDKLVLAAAGNEIIWIMGFKTSDKFKVTENTKHILKMECENTADTNIKVIKN